MRWANIRLCVIKKKRYAVPINLRDNQLGNKTLLCYIHKHKLTDNEIYRYENWKMNTLGYSYSPSRKILVYRYCHGQTFQGGLHRYIQYSPRNKLCQGIWQNSTRYNLLAVIHFPADVAWETGMRLSWYLSYIRQYKECDNRVWSETLRGMLYTGITIDYIAGTNQYTTKTAISHRGFVLMT